MNYKSYFRSISFAVILAFFASCDKDFNEIGTNIVGGEHFDFARFSESSVLSFNQATGAVQSNNLPINSLGVYDNPVFGTTKAGFVTQLEMVNTNPTFDLALQPTGQVVVDSVTLAIPYFSTRLATANNINTYKLDSINGSVTNAMDLKIFESGYYLSDLDPATNFEQSQRYFSNQNSLFDSNIIGSKLNNSVNTSQNTQFVPDVREYKVKKRDNLLVQTSEIESRTAPKMALQLDKARFQNLIFNAPAGKLTNNTVFKEYFKGLYFHADATNGQMMRLDFTQGSVAIYYKEYIGLKVNPANPTGPKIPITFDNDSNPSTPEVIQYIIRTFVLNMRGNSVNLLQQTNAATYANAINAPNQTLGDEKLYLKGGAEGSVVLIDLFKNDLYGPDGISGAPNGISDLTDLKTSGVLINEANLTFYVDKNAMATAPEPQRIYLFDAKNNRPVFDFITDFTTSNTNPKFNKQIYGGLIEREAVAGGRGFKYKIRITNHLRNLVTKDSTNVRLGLAVTESINITANSWLRTPVTSSINRIPAASVMNPLGTILYGSRNSFSVPAEKKLKLEIYYTKPN